jgi:hypothetical protein
MRPATEHTGGEPMTRGNDGPERRRRSVFVTKNRESQCLVRLCISVRDVTTEAFLRNHAAMG